MSKMEEAKADYLAGMKYKDIAKKYDVSLNTVKSWKTRNKWQRKNATKKKVCTQKKKVCTQNRRKLRRHYRHQNYQIVMSLMISRKPFVCTIYSDTMRLGLIRKLMVEVMKMLLHTAREW